jgi:hypothetical protein
MKFIQGVSLARAPTSKTAHLFGEFVEFLDVLCQRVDRVASRAQVTLN